MRLRVWTLEELYHGVIYLLDFLMLFFCVNLMQVYQEKGVKDKERYRTELMEYKSNNNSTPSAH